MFCQCVHAPGLLKSCHMLSSSSVPKSVTPLSFHSPPLSLSLYLSILSLCRCGRTDCCSVTSTALTFQQRRIRWQFHIPLSLSSSLSGMWHCCYSLSLFFSISPSHSCLSLCFSALSHISCLNWKEKVLQSLKTCMTKVEWELIDTGFCLVFHLRSKFVRKLYLISENILLITFFLTSLWNIFVVVVST